MSDRMETFGAELKITGQETAVDAQKKVEGLEQSIVDLSASFLKGDVPQDQYLASMKQLKTELRANEQALRIIESANRKQAESMEDLARAEDRAAASASKVGKAVKESGQDMGKARAGVLDLSRAVQDFAQGGVGGILNNLEGVGRAIPAILADPLALISSVPAILTTVGTALYIFGPKVWHAFEGFVGGSNAIPPATTALQRLEGKLGEVTKQLDAMREKQTLTNAELVIYNGLTAYQIQLEKQKTAEMQKQADVQALRKLKAPGADEAQRERAEVVQSAVGGKQKETEDALAAQLTGQDREKNFGDRRILEGQIANTAPGVNRSVLEKQLRALNDRIRRSERGELFAEFQRQAEEMLASAATGNEQAIGQVSGLMRGGDQFALGAPLENVRQQFEQASPAGMKARRDERHAIEQQQHDAKAAADAKRKKEQEDNKLDREQEKQRKDRHDREVEQARVRLAHPEQTEALLGPDALDQADAVVHGGPETRAPRPAARPRGAAPRQAPSTVFVSPDIELPAVAPPAFNQSEQERQPVRRRAAAAKPAAAPELPIPIAALPGFIPENGPIRNPLAGLKGTKLKKARRAQRLEAARAEKQRRDMQRTFRIATARPLPSTVIPSSGRPRAPQAPARLDQQPPVVDHPAAAAPPKGNAWHEPAVSVPGPQASLVPELAKPIAATQEALAKLQAQTARDHQIIEMLNERSRALTNRNVEGTISALNSGSSTC